MLGGRIVETGGPELAEELHQRGYDRIRAAYPEAAAEEAAFEDESRSLAPGWYEPPACSRRHLTMPLKRLSRPYVRRRSP